VNIAIACGETAGGETCQTLAMAALTNCDHKTNFKVKVEVGVKNEERWRILSEYYDAFRVRGNRLRLANYTHGINNPLEIGGRWRSGGRHCLHLNMPGVEQVEGDRDTKVRGSLPAQATQPDEKAFECAEMINLRRHFPQLLNRARLVYPAIPTLSMQMPKP
jgi:hypothetical protein